MASHGALASGLCGQLQSEMGGGQSGVRSSAAGLQYPSEQILQQSLIHQSPPLVRSSEAGVKAGSYNRPEWESEGGQLDKNQLFLDNRLFFLGHQTLPTRLPLAQYQDTFIMKKQHFVLSLLDIYIHGDVCACLCMCLNLL